MPTVHTHHHSIIIKSPSEVSSSKTAINQPIDRSIDQSINQTINQSINQSINETNNQPMVHSCIHAFVASCDNVSITLATITVIDFHHYHFLHPLTNPRHHHLLLWILRHRGNWQTIQHHKPEIPRVWWSSSVKCRMFIGRSIQIKNNTVTTVFHFFLSS